ncbi:hypothetical protein DFA_00793 [Cavenderia fasciculata]|uniref:MJ1316 RNA cyclic group end recognition domain-containing protein n=1 Tax=Cavenderia fasciculata TaxID=261658 RepID=F4PTU7_CACFS|nr:uncharacterized protein DFA_00793 [Cavenderia fasciculata]EGG20926.1 hypothetical protein DFA_00793 [Cavenderia fasciculata]|eukprot:XP_004358776.1 hypothetical protein DFA_00793 [Cavenderia fasciculata]
MENQQPEQQEQQEQPQQQERRIKSVLDQPLPEINNQLSGSSGDESEYSSSEESRGNKKKRVPRKKNTVKSENEVVLEEKKARLPSAEEIYNRIKWDVSMVENVDNFQIGYEDRFDGIKFVIFSEFEIGVIPLHRVKQFKHNEKLVWDRASRLYDFPEFQQPESSINAAAEQQQQQVVV